MPQGQSPLAPAGPARALIVLKDAAARRIAEPVLHGAGYVVSLASSADSARAACALKPAFALVIVDVTLPDSLELVRELRERLGDRAPPILVLSARPLPSIPEGVLAVLRMPTRRHELVAAVKALGPRSRAIIEVQSAAMHKEHSSQVQRRPPRDAVPRGTCAPRPSVITRLAPPRKLTVHEEAASDAPLDPRRER